MKITLLQGAFLPVPALRGGAVEKMWFRLGQEFAARGHAVTHVSRRCDGLPVSEEIGGVRHLRVPGFDRPRSQLVNQLRDLRYTLRARRHLPDADVVVTNTFWAPLLLPRRCGSIYVDVQRMPRGQTRYYRRAARLRANSSAVATAITTEAPQLADRVRIIPNPLSHAGSHTPDWAAKTNTVLFAGRLHAEKGIELLLEAWRRRATSSPLANWQLELVGPTRVAEGGGGEAWADALQRKFADASVAWRAPVYDEEQLARVYERAKVFAYPSLAEQGETFGLAVLEAMAWGAVPVVSDLACFRDFVRSGENGWIFDHRQPDAAERLLAGLERAATGRWDEVARHAIEVRTSHALGTIAEAFLQDFAQLV